MAVPATPKQSAYLWGFSVKYRYDGKSIAWNKLAKEGKLEKVPCIKLIGALKSWEQNKGNFVLKSQAASALQVYDPNFRFNADDPMPKKPDLIEEVNKDLDEDYCDLELMDALKKALHPNLYGRVDVAFKEYERKLEQQVKQGYSDVELPDGTDYIKPELFNKAYAILIGSEGALNLLIDGPAGCGKSRLGREMAAARGIDYTAISMSGGVRYTQVFGGSQLVVDESGKQKTEFVEGPLLKAIQKAGVVSIEEIFSADPDVLLGLNSILETSDRKILTPKGVIEAHPECYLMATANTNGRSISAQFTGAQRADDSLNDRFCAVHMDYDEEVEARILEGVKDKKVRVYLSGRLSLLRRNCRSNNISFDPSTRRLISCLKCLKSGLSAEEAFEVSFLSHLSKAERMRVEF